MAVFYYLIIVIRGGRNLMITEIFEFVKKYEELSKKYPLVKKEFFFKSIREQNIENNQEIHEINQRLEKLENKIKDK